MGMTFNGQRRSYLIVLRGRERPAWAPIEHEFIEIPSRPGAYVKSKNVKVRQINVPVWIKGENISNIQKLKEDLAEWLITDSPVPLVFDDEPDRIYYAEVTGSFDPEEIVNFGTGVISFICPDPYKYGQMRRGVFESEFASVANSGTKETYPTFKGIVKEPITFLDIITDDAYMRIGEPVNITETPIEREQIILDDDLKSTVGWGVASSIEGGTVTGSMVSNGNDFISSNYGTGSTWHGPALKKSLSEQLQDFRAEFYLKQDNQDDAKMIGRAVASLLDVNNNIVALVRMEDIWGYTKSNIATIRVGDNSNGHEIIHTTGKTDIWWNKFQGVLRIERVGNRFHAYVANITRDGRVQHFRTWSDGFTDIHSKYMNKIAQVQLHLGQYGTRPLTSQAFQRVRVYKINNNTNVDIPYIARAGDTVEIDHSKNLILINGEDRKDLKDFGASYFSLRPGINNIQISPYSSLDSFEVEWRPRYL